MSKSKHHKNRKRSRRHHVAPPGSAPGTLIVDPQAGPPAIRLMAYGPDTFHEQTITNLATLQSFLNAYPVIWVDVDGLGDLDTIRELGELFQLHALALEDVVNVYQRPKVESYGEHYFIVARMASFAARLETEQLSIFLGANFVLTFQDSLPGDCLDSVRQRLRAAQGRFRHHGPDYLAYSLLDAVVDSNFPVLEHVGELLDSLEEDLLDHPDQHQISQIHSIKRDLLQMRRAAWPLRDALHTLSRDAIPLIRDETRVYLRDCYDHALRIIELIESDRELCSDLIDLYLSNINNRMNEVMKVLTVFSAIFIPLTFVCSIYGMNFNAQQSPWNMPELNWYFGYPTIVGVMIAIAVALIAFFFHKGWLAPLNPRNVLKKPPSTERAAPGPTPLGPTA